MDDDGVAGAQDIANFSVRLADGYLPAESSITHEGMFNEHFFAVGSEQEKPLSCQWSIAASPDPISGQVEYFVGCGLRGRLDGEGIRKHGRPRLNLVIVLDISGSMSDSFRSEDSAKNKLEVAKDCVVALVDHLTPDDSFGLVAFDTRTEVVQKLTSMKTLDVAAFKKRLFQLQPRGGTDMERGIHGGAQLFDNPPAGAMTVGNQNRIMFLTDARPNSGSTSPQSLFGICKTNAEQHKIYTSFFGLGVDFGVELVDAISRIPACNYFTVLSPKEFKELMDRDFDYVVTPSCFNVQVKIASSSTVQPERVYGSPRYEIPKEGVLLQILSTFPSPKEHGDLTKGGIVLIRLKAPQQQQEDSSLKVVLSYDDIDGKHHSEENTIAIDFGRERLQKGYHYSNSAIRKAIALARFVNLMKWWIRDTAEGNTDASTASVSHKAGVPVPPVEPLGTQAKKMAVSAHYRSMLALFLRHYECELDALAAMDGAGGEESGEHQHLVEHTRKLVSLINHVSADQIAEKLHAVLSDEEVEDGSVDARGLRERVELALGGSGVDLADRQHVFDQEIRRRIKEVLLRKLEAAVAAEGAENLAKDKARRDAVAKQAAAFALARKDSAREEDWLNIAAELQKNLLGQPG